MPLNFQRKHTCSVINESGTAKGLSAKCDTTPRPQIDRLKVEFLLDKYKHINDFEHVSNDSDTISLYCTN